MSEGRKENVYYVKKKTNWLNDALLVITTPLAKENNLKKNGCISRIFGMFVPQMCARFTRAYMLVRWEALGRLCKCWGLTEGWKGAGNGYF